MNKSVRVSMIALAGVSVLALAGCNDACKDLSNQVLQPTSAAEGLLSSFKTGADVKSSCPALLEAVKNIPDGASTVRQLAQDRFTDSSSDCVDWRTSTHWVYECHGGPFHHFCRAIPETYTFCEAWENHTTHEDGYVQAMTLSASLDMMYDKANQLCGQAESGNLDAAFGASQDLLRYINQTVKPQADQVSALACN